MTLCHISFLVPHWSDTVGQFTQYVSPCKLPAGHTGPHFFLNPDGLPVIWNDLEGDDEQ